MIKDVEDLEVYRRSMKLLALGSSDEVVTHLKQIKMIGFPGIKPETCEALINHYRIVSKQVNNLIKKWKNFNSD